MRARYKKLIAGLSAFAALLAAALIAYVAASTWQRTRWRPAALRRVALMAKRARGPPSGDGRVTVVVTDIEGYSDLMKAVPDLMTTALGMHNTAIRRAAFANAGAVLEQEGDSYTVAFYDPLDAAVFCLQARGGREGRGWGRRGLRTWRLRLGWLGLRSLRFRGDGSVEGFARACSVAAGRGAPSGPPQPAALPLAQALTVNVPRPSPR